MNWKILLLKTRVEVEGTRHSFWHWDRQVARTGKLSAIDTMFSRFATPRTAKAVQLLRHFSTTPQVTLNWAYSGAGCLRERCEFWLSVQAEQCVCLSQVNFPIVQSKCHRLVAWSATAKSQNWTCSCWFKDPWLSLQQFAQPGIYPMTFPGIPTR